MKKLTLLFFILFLTLVMHAQLIRPKGMFLGDSLRLGAPIKYSLSVNHSSEVSILFPDSSYNYHPFEFISKEYYPTKTINGISRDSAVYILRSFEINKAQSLSLPIYVELIEDSTAIYSKKDSVILKEYLPESPINENFKEDVKLSKIPKAIDYPYISAYIIVALLIILIIYFFFGKTIRRRIRLITIRIDHNKFIKGYHRLEEDFSVNKEPTIIESSLSMWKVYLSKLENKPINTFTTTEILNLFQQEDLKSNLDTIDKAIYAGIISEETAKALTSLRRFSVRHYHRRKKEIQNV